LNEEASLRVLSATPDRFAPLAQYELAASPTWTVPAITADAIYVRSRRALFCYELPQ
jgi:hypothetical protein